MSEDKLAEHIFRHVHGNSAQEDFGFRRVSTRNFEWSTEHYALKVTALTKNVALLYATYKPTNRLSMIRRYTYGKTLEETAIDFGWRAV